MSKVSSWESVCGIVDPYGHHIMSMFTATLTATITESAALKHESIGGKKVLC